MTDESNVIPLRPSQPFSQDPHPFEVVEIIHWYGLGFNEFWVAAAGPWSEPPDFYRGGRNPWERKAVFPKHEPQHAAYYARELAAQLGVEIMDFAGVMQTLVPPRGSGPEAA